MPQPFAKPMCVARNPHPQLQRFLLELLTFVIDLLNRASAWIIVASPQDREQKQRYLSRIERIRLYLRRDAHALR